jgi:hypothetical protein
LNNTKRSSKNAEEEELEDEGFYIGVGRIFLENTTLLWI